MFFEVVNVDASQVVTGVLQPVSWSQFASRGAGILVGRQELLIWGTTKPSKLDLQADPKLHSRPRHPL
jgi:hypothetical protein